MPALSDYTAGTITLTNGSVNFTGAGTGWQAADFREGDTILGIEDNAGVEYVIASITGNGAGTLTQEWEGATGTYAYRMRYMADGARVTAQARNLIELLGNGNLQAEASLTGAADTLSYYTGPAAKALTPLTPFARTLLDDADAATALSTLGAQPAGSYQPLDADLTAIAALTTQPYGRSLLTLASQSALAGEVQEWGSNVEGEYLRLRGGVQICWRTGAGYNITSAAGSIFVNGAALPSLAWPAAFNGPPHEFVTGHKIDGTPGHCWATSVLFPTATHTSAVQLFRATSSSDGFYAVYLGIGTYTP